MISTPIAELLVPYDPIPLTEKVARRRRAVVSRIISLVITIVILVAVFFWQREQLQGCRYPGLLVVFAIPLVWLIVVLIRYLLARRRLRTLGYGTAVRIGPPGIQVAGLAAPWPQVAARRGDQAGDRPTP